MKQIFIAMLLAATGLVACSKSDSDAYVRPQPTFEHFFSRVNYFTDGRTPYTDTVWTLRLMNQTMIDSFSVYDGRIVSENSYSIQIDTIWKREVK